MCCIWEPVAFVMSVALYICHKYKTAEAKAMVGILPSCADAVGVTAGICSLLH